MARVERLLFVVAVVALGWYASEHASAALYQASQNRELEALRAERQHAQKDIYLASHVRPKPVPAREDAESPATSAASAPREASATSVRRALRPSTALIGRIEIPRLRLSAIVHEGVDDQTLRRAVGHVPDTALPGGAGNVAFAGHRDTFFLPLKRIRVGDRIDVATPDGDFSYVVRDTRIVEATDVSVLEPTAQPTLTLITCYPFNVVGSAPDRFIVRAEAVAR